MRRRAHEYVWHHRGGGMRLYGIMRGGAIRLYGIMMGRATGVFGTLSGST